MDRENDIRELFMIVKREGFPYARNWNQHREQEYFQRLKQSWCEVVSEKYQLKSFMPKWKLYLPPNYGNYPTRHTRNKYQYQIQNTRPVYIKSGKFNINDSIEQITDLFIEDIRMKARRKESNDSTLDSFNDDATLLKWVADFYDIVMNLKRGINNEFQITGFDQQSFRNYIYHHHSETTTFPILWARTLIKIVTDGNYSGLSWLDISSGWGDRLIAAMTLDMNYIGFDPNSELQPRYQRMIEKFGSSNRRYLVIPEPFEYQNWTEGKFDIVLSSTPYWDLEIYTNIPGQSTEYGSIGNWLNYFLWISLMKAWNALKRDGWFLLHIGDSKSDVNFVEQTLLFMEQYLEGNSYYGCIGVKGNFIRPCWIFRKDYRGARYYKENFENRSLDSLYPGLLDPSIFMRINQGHSSPYVKGDQIVVDQVK